MFLSAISEFFYKYGIYIAIAIVVIMIAIIAFLLIRNKVKKDTKQDDEIYESIIKGLGGEDNILTMEAKMSRLNLTLKDDNLLQVDYLKEKGVSRIIKMSSKITLLIGNKAEEIEQRFNKK